MQINLHFLQLFLIYCTPEQPQILYFGTAIRLSIIAVFYTAKQKKRKKNLRMCNFCCTFVADFNLHEYVRTRRNNK